MESMVHFSSDGNPHLGQTRMVRTSSSRSEPKVEDMDNWFHGAISFGFGGRKMNLLALPSWALGQRTRSVTLRSPNAAGRFRMNPIIFSSILAYFIGKMCAEGATILLKRRNWWQQPNSRLSLEGRFTFFIYAHWDDFGRSVLVLTPTRMTETVMLPFKLSRTISICSSVQGLSVTSNMIPFRVFRFFEVVKLVNNLLPTSKLLLWRLVSEPLPSFFILSSAPLHV